MKKDSQPITLLVFVILIAADVIYCWFTPSMPVGVAISIGFLITITITLVEIQGTKEGRGYPMKTKDIIPGKIFTLEVLCRYEEDKNNVYLYLLSYKKEHYIWGCDTSYPNGRYIKDRETKGVVCVEKFNQKAKKIAEEVTIS